MNENIQAGYQNRVRLSVDKTDSVFQRFTTFGPYHLLVVARMEITEMDCLPTIMDVNEELTERMLAIARTLTIHCRQESKWESSTYVVVVFPILPLEYVISKTFGTHQVKLAPAYIQDTTERAANNEFSFQVQQFGLLGAKIFSRLSRSICKILKHNKYHPYHVSFHKDLHGVSLQNRVTLCQRAREQIQQNPNFFQYVLFSDESTF
ncbi:hypothetical protein NQ317_000451 [Molorchus minor]|uniref:Uncharacterized protein n=1 Tax=Molorchus minor TaxID=1323400 RepID=A0ABQ9JJ24_9CUCU|nr:hypothetical protein NQ317_000451 [Molorchus minor]